MEDSIATTSKATIGRVPKMLVIAGPNGAGKTTFSRPLLYDTLGFMEYVNADTIVQGLSGFQPDKAAIAAGRVMLERLHYLSEREVTFGFETTLSGFAYAKWIQEARQRGYEFHLFFLSLRTPELAVERVRQRVKAGGHDITEEVIRRRYRSGLRNFFRVYQALTDSWGMYDNSEASGPFLIAAGSGTETPLIYREDLWVEICEAAQ
jgi:predicted ABC-type ATPase